MSTDNRTLQKAVHANDHWCFKVRPTLHELITRGDGYAYVLEYIVIVMNELVLYGHFTGKRRDSTTLEEMIKDEPKT